MFRDCILFLSNEIQGSNNIFQNTNSDINIKDCMSITEQEREILRIYNTLSVKEKAYLFLDVCKYEN